MEPEPSGLRPLTKVAARAVFLRAVADADWGDRTEQAVGTAFAELREALHQLELSEPAIHAQLAQDMDLVIADLRADLGND